MRTASKFLGLVSIGVIVLLINVLPSTAAEVRKNAPQPKLIPLDLGAKESMRVLGGPPETVTMRSGLVLLDPGDSVGKHNTKKYEETLVILEGTGDMTITDGPRLQLTPGSVAYCPPRTEHDVMCTGPTRLKYVYIVANAE